MDKYRLLGAWLGLRNGRKIALAVQLGVSKNTIDNAIIVGYGLPEFYDAMVIIENKEMNNERNRKEIVLGAAGFLLHKDGDISHFARTEFNRWSELLSTYNVVKDEKTQPIRLPSKDISIRKIKHMSNGQTSFDVFTRHKRTNGSSTYYYHSSHVLNGHIKRDATIKKRICIN